jgi:hypothetical protein
VRIPTTFVNLLDWTPMMASISRVSVTDCSQFDDSVSVLFGATVSHECRTTDHESKWVISDDLQVGPLGAARQRPKGGEVLG